jgi:predicted transcriptional regulator
MAKPFYFDPTAKGPAVFMGPTEARLMEIAWEQESLTVKQALFHLGEDNQRAYTTVMTVLARLAEKGFLTRERTGRSFVYRSNVDREPFLKSRIEIVTACLKKNFPRHR